MRAAGVGGLSADRSSGAPSVANALSLRLDEVYGEMKPTDKLKLVEKLQAEGHVVAMAGEGLIDAPALARAAVGNAMGTGTDVAMNSASASWSKATSAALPQSVPCRWLRWPT